MAEHKRSLARKIRQMRQVAGMTRVEADAVFGDRGRYQNMEDGKTSISHANRRALANLFEVHLSMLRTKGE